MVWPFYLFCVAFGLIVGSFLNAVVYRMEKGESALKGRSYCPKCAHRLSWFDLIPVASFVFLLGRCRYCRQKISWQYPVIELATAAVFFSIFSLQSEVISGENFELFTLAYLFTIASLLVVLFVYDLRHYILPDKILFPAIGITFLYQVSVWCIENWGLIQNSEFKIQNFGIFANPLLAGLLAASFFLIIFLASRGKAMGFGDVKLALFMGLFLGWPNIAVALFIAFWLGAIIGVSLIVLKKKGLKSEVPFGPFLITGTFLALFWGERIVHVYTQILF